MTNNDKKQARAEATSPAATNITTSAKFLRITAAVKYSGLSRALLYQLIGQGKIKTHKVGACRIVSRESLDTFITSH